MLENILQVLWLGPGPDFGNFEIIVNAPEMGLGPDPGRF